MQNAPQIPQVDDDAGSQRPDPWIHMPRCCPVDHQRAEKHQRGGDLQCVEEDGVLILPQEPLILNEVNIALILVILFLLNIKLLINQLNNQFH
jgi:hypothetical protein